MPATANKSGGSFLVSNLLILLTLCALRIRNTSCADLAGSGTLDFLPLSASAHTLTEDFGTISTNSKFPFGPIEVDAFYVTQNGYFRAQSSPLSLRVPNIPGSFYVVAPYSADIYGGLIRYTDFSETHSELGTVNTFIESKIGTNFNGTNMMIAEWKEVRAIFYSSFASSTFQAVLITNGTASYAVFIYDCGGMNWNGAVIGWAYSNNYGEYDKHFLSGSRSDKIGCYYSNDTSQNSAIIYRIDTCYSWRMVCANQQCTYGDRCDGHVHCEDGSDEIGCTCSSYEFSCNNSRCILDAFRCDGINNCQDNSDEEHCENHNSVHNNLGLTLGMAIGLPALFCIGILFIIGIIVFFIIVRQRRTNVGLVTAIPPSSTLPARMQTTSFTNYPFQSQPLQHTQGFAPVIGYPHQQPPSQLTNVDLLPTKDTALQ